MYALLFDVKDGSLDNSKVIIDKYKIKFLSKIRSYTKENDGFSDVRNEGIKYKIQFKLVDTIMIFQLKKWKDVILDEYNSCDSNFQ